MNNNLGQSLYEVVFAIGIAAVILIALVALATVSVRNTTFSKNKAIATELSEEALEWLRSEKVADWGAFAARDGTWCLPDLNWGTAGFGGCSSTDYVNGTRIVREIIINVESADTILMTIELSWQDSQGSHEVNSETYFTKWKPK